MSPPRTIARSVAWTRAASRAGSGDLASRRDAGALVSLAIAALPWGFFAVAGGLFTVATSFGTPHLRWSYSYLDRGGAARLYTQCSYVGLEPFMQSGGPCPLIVWRSLHRGETGDESPK
jgi:hypothetical protein